jgi:PhzF family phenazine biosynthesis protein
MQLVAREMNLSETAFLVPKGARTDGEDGFDLRWFTPTVEVDLCGHATLASAHVLWETGTLSRATPARFFTKSGVLTAKLSAGGDRPPASGERIELDFPSTPAVEAESPSDLEQVIGAPVRYFGKNRFDYLVEVESEAVVARLEPDLERMSKWTPRGVIVTSAGTSTGVDFVSRFFAPGAGIEEDPVTGSAHCSLAPYWSPRLGKRTFLARQLSARGGELQVVLSDEGDRVLLRGRAVTVLRGELMV